MIKKGLSLISLGLGVFLLVQVVMPYVAFKTWEATYYTKDTLLLDPAPLEEVLGVAVENIGNFPAIVSKITRAEKPAYLSFKLSIPKLKIKDAKVLVESNNFEQNLAHMPATALPGEKGNVFITGHSSLAPFFEVSNSKAIFINLAKLKKNDKIIAQTNEGVYIYVVEGIKIIDPKDLSVVQPPDNIGRYLTLMTCVPPGFNTQRLIVLARLQN